MRCCVVESSAYRSNLAMVLEQFLARSRSLLMWSFSQNERTVMILSWLAKH